MIEEYFCIYGDSWFEILKFINSLYKSLMSACDIFDFHYSVVKKNIKNYNYLFVFKFNDLCYKIEFSCFGKYKNNVGNLNIKSLLLSGGKPDLLILKNSKIIFGVEDTETSQVGSASFQRMERMDFFIRNKIPFLYVTFFTTFDKSKKRPNKRNQSYSQLLLFEKFENLEILYKKHQNKASDEDELLIGKYFLHKILNIKRSFEDSDKLKENIIQTESYKNLKILSRTWFLRSFHHKSEALSF